MSSKIRWSHQSSFSGQTNEMKDKIMDNNNIREQNILMDTEQQHNEAKVFSQEELLEMKTNQYNSKAPLKQMTLRRTHCNVKEGRSGLNFSTLFVSKFIRRIKEVSSLMRFKEMGLVQFELIKDVASDYNYFFMKGAFSKESPSLFDKMGQAILKKNSHFRMLWNALLFMVLISNIIYIPLKYSFDLENDLGDYNWVFNVLPQTIFLAEIFLNFHTACSWYKVGELSASSGEAVTWLNSLQKDTVPDSFYAFYITSLYWAVVTMITLGYGDIVPKNWKERLFVIFITQLSCIIFAYSTNSIGEILREMARKGLTFKNQMGLIDTYMRKRGLRQLTQMKVRKYFEYLNKESLEDSEKSNDLISGLPQTLKEEVYSDAYGRVLKQKKIFSLNFSQPFLNELSLLMRERRLGPEEELFKFNDISDSIYIVMKGKVQVFLGNGRMLKVLVKGDLIGEIGFFSGRKTDYKAVTLNVASLAVLKKEDFLSVIRHFPTDHEQFSLMKDNINLYDNIKGLDHKCMGCGSYTHCLSGCQFVNYSKNQHKVLNLYTKNYIQKRIFFERKHLFKFKTLQNLKHVYDCVVRQIFVSSKFAKAQDLQEELSDMDSDSSDIMSHNYDGVEGDEVEASKAAISMISTISPQFTKDFLSRTKIQYNNSVAEEKPQKASMFANFQKKTKQSSSEEEKSDQNQNESSSLDQQNISGEVDQEQINPEKIIEENHQQERTLDSYEETELENQTNFQDEVIETERVEIVSQKYNNAKNEIISLDDQSTRLKNTNGIQSSDDNFLLSGSPSSNGHTHRYKGQDDYDNNNLAQIKQKSFTILPKQGFLNLKRPSQRDLLMKFTQNNIEQNKEDCFSSENSLLAIPNISLTQRFSVSQTNNNINNSEADFSLSQVKRKRYNRWAKSQKESKGKNQESIDNLVFFGNLSRTPSTVPLLNLIENKIFTATPKKDNNEKIIHAENHQSLEFSSPNNNQQSIEPSSKIKSLEQVQQELKIGGWLSPIPKVFEQGGFSPSVANIIQNTNKNNHNGIHSANNFVKQQTTGISIAPLALTAMSTTNIPSQASKLNLRKLPHSLSFGNVSHFRTMQTKEFRNINSIHEELETSRISITSKEQVQSTQQFSEHNQMSRISDNNFGVSPELPQKIGKYTSSQTSIKLLSAGQLIHPSCNELQHCEVDKNNQLYEELQHNSRVSQDNRKVELIMGEQCLFAYNFDRLKEYEKYFPQFNYSSIITKFNNIRKKNLGYRMMATKKRIEVRKRLAIFSKLKI